METFITYVKIQAFVFLCGIVGPIFLIVYFSIQPEQDTRWLYWTGLFITAADVLIALAITDSSARADKAHQKSTKARERV
ncbi:hypothetical protein [Mycobacterium sp. AT1]|uniref:hypothetical protein n=1 Tax=Mycobacterium sp. AT1 TaxID=1961706 RepID=UPI0009AC6D61|nr:hypothetical protein [Mycobacterium sp. AT1]OPX12137.1 hypothetical protein B1790_04580 [Mycobacterium sp. AT1]